MSYIIMIVGVMTRPPRKAGVTDVLTQSYLTPVRGGTRRILILILILILIVFSSKIGWMKSDLYTIL